MKKYLFLFSCVLLFAGCQNAENQTIQSPLATPFAQENVVAEEKISVVASFYPLAFLTEEIGKDAVEVHNLAGAKGLHGFAISPLDLQKILEADVVVMLGKNAENWEKTIDEKNISALKLNEKIELLEHNDEHHEEHEEENHAEENAEEHEEHHHEGGDPHTWLDPILAQQMVLDIANALSEKNPAKKEFFLENAKILNEKFAKIDADFQSKLQNCVQKEAIISHDFLGYLEKRYGFELHAIAGISTEDEPSAQTLAELKKEAEDEKLTAILTENNALQAFVDTVARETKLQVLPFGSLEEAPLPNLDFFGTMQQNVQNLTVAFQCQ